MTARDGRGGESRLQRLRERVARNLSLRDRVTIATALVLALGLTVLTAGAFALLSHQLDADASNSLQTRADARGATIMRIDGRTTVDDRSRIGTFDEPSWVFAANGRVLRAPSAPSDVDRAARKLVSAVGATGAVESDGPDNIRLRGGPVVGAGGERIATVVVGTSLEPYERTEHLAILALLALDLCIVVLGALLARRAVGKALQPVADMTAQAAEWSERDLDRRFDLGPPRDELTALSATLDALMTRVAASVRREQRFSAELAHELRTPLSGVRAEAELALGSPKTSGEAAAALERVLRGTDRMEQAINALLTAARGESADAAARRGVADARDAARAAVDPAALAGERAGVQVRLEPEVGVAAFRGSAGGGGTAGDGRGSAAGDERSQAALRVGAEPPLVVQALQPLLDNAIRHARSTVTVRLERDGSEALVHVEDDGDGIAFHEAERVFAPGASGSGGAGLGLPLARRLARSCGGDVVAVARDHEAGGVGGHVVLRLPLVA
ncbi:MAG TPA: ATP-binding protein [Conexibacter sp.]|jgi:signal transduction histidine kinase